MKNLIRSGCKYLWPLLLLTESCAHQPTTSAAPTTAEDTLLIDNNAIVEVRTIVTSVQPFNTLIISNGKIQSQQEQLVIAPVSGIVKLSTAATGKHVSKGSLIALLDTIPASIELKRARLNQYNSQKEYESQLLGYRQLLEGKSEAQTQEIQKKLQIASGLSTAEEDIHQALYRIEQAHLLAPFSGVLAQIKIQEGKYLNAGEELFRIYDPAHLVAKVKVTEAEMPYLHIGMKAEVIALSDSTRRITALLNAIDPYIDENGLLMIELGITGSNTFIPGMNCLVRIAVPAASGIVIPRDAVVKRSEKDVVFTLDNGEAKWNYVTVGKDNGEEVQITSGLTSGQKVIITNNLQLSHNSPVKEVK